MKNRNVEQAMKPGTLTRLQGFALVEAMVAGLIMAFGMLAVIGLQLSLSRNTDFAKSRTEATRLAQEQIEELRSYTQITPSPTTALWATQRAWDNMPASGTETVTTNNAYTVSWSTANGGISTTDVMRTISVNVSWTDRAGEAHVVTLNSVISRSDPADSGFLGFPLPQNTNLKRPKNRNIDIPIPAVDLGGGKSGYQITNRLAVIFSNNSGLVIQKCESANPFTIDENYDTSNCTTSSALLLAGYISRSSTSVAWPTGMGMNYAGITSANNDDIVCKFGNAVNQTTNAAINGYKFYICIIPISDATSPPNTWSGTLRVGGLPTNSNYYVCRFQYNNTDLDNNSRNIQPYSGVEKSLDGQNFYIMTGANNAGCGEPTDPGNAITSVLHQNCRPNGTAGECPAASPNNYTS